MQKKDQTVWYPPLAQSIEHFTQIQMRRVSTQRLPYQPTNSKDLSNDVCQEISSPTFHKPQSLHSKPSSNLNSSFSFCQQMFDQLDQLVDNSSSSSKNQMKNYFQSYDSFCSTKHQKQINRNKLDTVLILLNNFISNLKIITKTVKLNVIKYQENFTTNATQIYNIFQSLTQRQIEKYKKYQIQLQSKIATLLQEQYFQQQKYKLQKKKTKLLQNKIEQLIHTVNQQKINNSNYHQKYLELSQQLQNKIKDNLKLLQNTSILKQQIAQLKKNNKQNQLQSNQVYQYQISISNADTPERILQSSSAIHTHRNTCLASSNTNNSTHPPQDYLPCSVDSIAFCSQKCHTKLPSTHHLNHSFNTQKQNKEDSWYHPKHPNDHLNKTFNQPKTRKKSTLSAQLNLIENRCETEKKIKENKNILLAKIKKLKDDIKSEITDLKKETH